MHFVGVCVSPQAIVCEVLLLFTIIHNLWIIINIFLVVYWGWKSWCIFTWDQSYNKAWQTNSIKDSPWNRQGNGVFAWKWITSLGSQATKFLGIIIFSYRYLICMLIVFVSGCESFIFRSYFYKISRLWCLSRLFANLQRKESRRQLFVYHL